MCGCALVRVLQPTFVRAFAFARIDELEFERVCLRVRGCSTALSRRFTIHMDWNTVKQ